MPDIKPPLLAMLAVAMLTSPGLVAAAEAYPVPPPFRGDVVREHEAEVRCLTLRDLERDIHAARSAVMEKDFGEARQSTEFALALASSLADAPPAAVDPAEQARLHDATVHIDDAVKLFYKREPWEARRELRTAQIDVELFAGQKVS